MTIVLHLPFPPSLNHANKVGINRHSKKAFVYSSADKSKFFRDAGALFLMQKRRLSSVTGPFTYHLILNEEMRHGNSDGDNRGKYALDFAQKIGLIENDKLAAGGSWSWGPCEYGAMLSIHPVASASSEASQPPGQPCRAIIQTSN